VDIDKKKAELLNNVSKLLKISNFLFNQPTTIFDNCGFKTTEYLEQFTEKSYIIPSSLFKNSTDFLNKIEVPFFAGYKFEIFDDSNLNSTEADLVDRSCFKSSEKVKFSFIVFLFILCLFLV